MNTTQEPSNASTIWVIIKVFVFPALLGYMIWGFGRMAIVIVSGPSTMEKFTFVDWWCDYIVKWMIRVGPVIGLSTIIPTVLVGWYALWKIDKALNKK